MEFDQYGHTYETTMEFSFWWKKMGAFFKKWGRGGNMSGLRNVVSMLLRLYH